MQRRADQITLACESFTPQEFVGIIRADANDQLVAVAIDSSQRVAYDERAYRRSFI